MTFAKCSLSAKKGELTLNMPMQRHKRNTKLKSWIQKCITLQHTVELDATLECFNPFSPEQLDWVKVRVTEQAIPLQTALVHLLSAFRWVWGHSKSNITEKKKKGKVAPNF